jgi:poly-gamma-glutamate synthesis protein (capsule biosynthesis protein)
MRLALAGDTMLGRGVAEQRGVSAPRSLVALDLAALMRDADVILLNLECCISERGQPYRRPGKPFVFRAPPSAVELLTHLGVDCATLANNHALDLGEVALLDTCAHLSSAGIAWVGAGADLDRARAPTVVGTDGARLAAVGFTDHPAEYAAAPGRPGVAYTEPHEGVARWVTDVTRRSGDPVVVTPHWGPNMAPAPRRRVRDAAAQLVGAGASLVAGQSAHVFHGVAGRVLYDLGDFLDDYAVDTGLRSDLGLLFLVDIEPDGPRRLEAVPIKVDYCHISLATGEDAEWIRRRFRRACQMLEEDLEDDLVEGMVDDSHPVLTWQSG